MKEKVHPTIKPKSKNDEDNADKIKLLQDKADKIKLLDVPAETGSKTPESSKPSPANQIPVSNPTPEQETAEVPKQRKKTSSASEPPSIAQAATKAASQDRNLNQSTVEKSKEPVKQGSATSLSIPPEETKPPVAIEAGVFSEDIPLFTVPFQGKVKGGNLRLSDVERQKLFTFVKVPDGPLLKPEREEAKKKTNSTTDTESEEENSNLPPISKAKASYTPKS